MIMRWGRSCSSGPRASQGEVYFARRALRIMSDSGEVNFALEEARGPEDEERLQP